MLKGLQEMSSTCQHESQKMLKMFIKLLPIVGGDKKLVFGYEVKNDITFLLYVEVKIQESKNLVSRDYSMVK